MSRRPALLKVVGMFFFLPSNPLPKPCPINLIRSTLNCLIGNMNLCLLIFNDRTANKKRPILTCKKNSIAPFTTLSPKPFHCWKAFKHCQLPSRDKWSANLRRE